MKEEDKRVVANFKALSCETRYNIIKLLSENSYSTLELSEILGKTPTTISKHLRILKNLGIVWFITKGKYVIYSLKRKSILEIIQKAKETLHRK